MYCGFWAAKSMLKVNIVILPVCSSKVLWGQEQHEYALDPDSCWEQPKNNGKRNILETQTLADYA